MNIRALAVLSVLFAVAGSVQAQDMSLNGFRNHALPVLVRVDSAGKVTDVRSSVELSPRTDRLLRANLSQMITRPAMQGGKAVSSQLVMQVALIKERQDDGRYSARFAYVSAIPVPAGNWYWVRMDGHRLALAQDELPGRHRYLRYWPSGAVPMPPPVMVPSGDTALPMGQPSAMPGMRLSPHSIRRR